jgi:hypothetical protein
VGLIEMFENANDSGTAFLGSSNCRRVKLDGVILRMTLAVMIAVVDS